MGQSTWTFLWPCLLTVMSKESIWPLVSLKNCPQHCYSCDRHLRAQTLSKKIDFSGPALPGGILVHSSELKALPLSLAFTLRHLLAPLPGGIWFFTSLFKISAEIISPREDNLMSNTANLEILVLRNFSGSASLFSSLIDYNNHFFSGTAFLIFINIFKINLWLYLSRLSFKMLPYSSVILYAQIPMFVLNKRLHMSDAKKGSTIYIHYINF